MTRGARPARRAGSPPIVLKLGGELLEDRGRLESLARAIARPCASHPLVVVHGGGREIDAALRSAGIEKRHVDGLRVTDEPTLAVVVSVLAGSVNTRLVAAVTTAGGAAVGLTGADAGVGLSVREDSHRTAGGGEVNLGLVGRPIDSGRPGLLIDLCAAGYVPIIASIGLTSGGELLNVNADTLAAHLASRLRSPRLIVAGAMPGVLDATGQTIPLLEPAGIDELIANGSASAGMVAKLRACSEALQAGVGEVVIADGRTVECLAALVSGKPAMEIAGCTRLIVRKASKEADSDLGLRIADCGLPITD